MGSKEFVALETGAFDSYFTGTRLSVNTGWGTGGWATQFMAGRGGGHAPRFVT